MSELFRNALLSIGDMLPWQQQACFITRWHQLYLWYPVAVARNRPATPVTGHFACDHGQQRLLCGMASVGLYGVHCRINLPDSKVIMTWCTVQVQEIRNHCRGSQGPDRASESMH